MDVVALKRAAFSLFALGTFGTSTPTSSSATATAATATAAAAAAAASSHTQGPRLIGLGWPRTGTGSLCDAAEVLGLAPCYHLRLLLKQTEEAWRPWEAVSNASRSHEADRAAELVVEALQRYPSAADVPVAAFWRELFRAKEMGLLRQDTVFVLPNRDGEDWYESAESTVLAGWREAEDRKPSRHVKRMSDLVWSRLLQRNRTRLRLPQERSQAIADYLHHSEQVVSAAPEGSLIRWNPQDGWGSLCEALGLPIPEVDFPHRNKRSLDFAAEFGFDSAKRGDPGGPAGQWLTAIACVFNAAFPLTLCWCFCCRNGSLQDREQGAEKVD